MGFSDGGGRRKRLPELGWSVSEDGSRHLPVSLHLSPTPAEIFQRRSDDSVATIKSPIEKFAQDSADGNWDQKESFIRKGTRRGCTRYCCQKVGNANVVSRERCP